jgi:Methyltransferase domain
VSALRRLVGRGLRATGMRPGREWLFGVLPAGGVGAEVGVWKGDFSARLLARTRPAHLHLIDPWRYEGGDERYEQARYGGAAAAGQEEMDAIHAGVLRRFDADIRRGVVEVHRETSAAAAGEFAAASFDWVYLDGNHLYEFVRRDLELYLPLIRPGGVLAGDDYGAAGWWDDGVTRAVDEAAAVGVCRLEAVRASQFVLRVG